MITVGKLHEHLTNMMIQGHQNVPVVIPAGLVVMPLSKGELCVLNNGMKALVLYPRVDEANKVVFDVGSQG